MYQRSQQKFARFASIGWSHICLPSLPSLPVLFSVDQRHAPESLFALISKPNLGTISQVFESYIACMVYSLTVSYIVLAP